MRGLIWKDILVMRKTLRFYLLVMGFYVVLSLLDLFSISVVSCMAALMVMTIPMSSFGYDEIARWDRVAGGFPLGRGEIVAARYVFILLMVLLALVVSLAAAVLGGFLGIDPMETVASMCGAMGAGLLYTDIILPICYKLGAERARPYMFAVMLLPVGAFLLLAKLGILDLSFLNQMEEMQAIGALALFPLLALVGLAPSYAASRRIYEQKEF